MQTVVYINNDSIKIVTAEHDLEFNISKYENIQLNRGTIVNGTIINKEEIQDKLVKYKEDLKDAVLLIDSSAIIAKKLDLPLMNKKQLGEVLKFELGVQDVKDEYIYDANIIKSDKGNSVLGCAIPKSLVESYVNLFQELDIKLSRIEISTNGIVKLVNSYKLLEEKTFILNLIVGENMISFLFEKGSYKLTNRNRIMSNPLDEDYVSEIFSKLSTIVQFNKSQKSEHTIKDSYYLGLDKDNVEKLKTYAALYEFEVEIVDVSMKLGDFSQNAGDVLYPLLGIIKYQNDINLLEAYKLSNKIEKIPQRLRLKLAVISILSAWVILSAIVMNIGIIRLNHQIKEYTEYIEAPETVSKLSEAKKYSNENTNLNKILEEIELSKSDIKKYKNFDKDDVEMIFAISGDKVAISDISYNSSTAKVTIVGLAKNELESSAFVKNLYKIGLFENVQYKGYSASEIHEKGLGYTFTAEAKLKAGEISEEVKAN